MADSLYLNAQKPAPASRPQLGAFLGLGFRPLYIAGCAWALISVAIWIFAPQWIGHPLSGLAWHAHEMLWAFVITIAVGFLLTASATWTGFNPLKGRWLGFVCVLWLIARVGYLVAGEPGFWIAAASELGFFVIAAVALLRVVVKGQSRRNYGIPLIVLGLGLANVLYLQATLAGDYGLLMQRFDLGLVGMAVLALLIARRVIPFFSMRMVPGLKIPALARSGQAQIALSVAAIVFGLLDRPAIMAAGLALVGVTSLYQLVRWRPWAVLGRPLLWILYLGYAFLGIGLLFAAIQLGGIGTGVLARAATHVHIIGMGGFSILIIGMVTRTSLGHLGRALVLDHSMRASYAFMIAAVILRLAALGAGGSTNVLLQATALCWIAALGLYLWRFVPMLIRPRPGAGAQLKNPPPAGAPVR